MLEMDFGYNEIFSGNFKTGNLVNRE